MPRRRLHGQFLSLAIGEGLAALVFAYVYWRFQQRSGTLFPAGVAYSFLLLEFLLIQGTLYWWVWVVRARRPFAYRPTVRLTYRAFRWINAVLLLGLPAAVWWSGNLWWLSAFLALFCVAEYVNYFFIRLSYRPGEFLQRLTKGEFSASLLARELAGKG